LKIKIKFIRKPTSVRPTARERRISNGELIVTKTGARGSVTYADDVHLRISASTRTMRPGNRTT
jgi:hypothetical protein